MREKSEFEKILNEKLYGSAAGAAGRSQSSSSTSSPNFDFLSKLFFNHGPVRAKVFGDTPYRSTPKTDAKAQAKAESTTETKVSQPEPPPPQRVAPPQKPREKRRRTFDQMKALKAFVQFGETAIDDYSTDEEIKSAYRRLARKFHPDLGAANDLPFKQISAAYSKLID